MKTVAKIGRIVGLTLLGVAAATVAVATIAIVADVANNAPVDLGAFANDHGYGDPDGAVGRPSVV